MNPTEITELKEWIKRNQETLRKYAPDEIAHLARMAGFSLQTICRVIPEASQDLRLRSTSQLRDEWYIDREIKFIEQKTKPSLQEQWHHLYQYDQGNTWF